MIGNLYDFKLLGTMISNYMMKWPMGHYTVDEHKKRVPQNINEILTARALAYWFADDGNSYQKARNRAYRFSTHSFPLEDQGAIAPAG